MKVNKLWPLLQQALSCIEGPQGSPRSDQSFHFERTLYVVGERLDLPGFHGTSAEKRQLVHSTLAALHDKGMCTLEQFQAQLAEEVSRLKSHPVLEFSTLFAMNLDTSSAAYLDGMTIGDLSIQIRTWDEVTMRLHLEHPWSLFESHDSLSAYRDNHEAYTYWVVASRSTNAESAFQTAFRQYELARALINYSLSAFTIIYSTPRQWSLISPSPVMPCYQGGNVVQQYFTVGAYKYEVQKLSEDQIRKSVQILAGLQKAKGALKTRLESAVLLYSEGMDQTDDAYRFLNLYQGLEVLLYAAKPGDVKDRLKALFVNRGETHAAIECLEHKRNLLVHQGRLREVDVQDVHFLKHFFDETVFKLLSDRDALGTETQFQQYWAVIAEGNDELRQRKAVLEHLLQQPEI